MSDVMECPTHGYQILQGRYCEECGVALIKRRECPCGETPGRGAKFCRVCGRPQK